MKNIQKLPYFLFLLFSTIFNVLFCSAQTVRLPSYQRMSASTTVAVPDGGGINTAGISRVSSGSNSSGAPILPFQNRSYGSTASTSTMNASVQIIDLHEMDEQILNSPSTPGVRRSGVSLSPEDRFQQRRERISEPKSDKNFSGMMNVRDGIRSQIQVRTAENDESERRQILQQSLNLSSVEINEGSSPKAESQTLNSELSLSLKVSPNPPPSVGQSDARTEKKLSEKNNPALILAKKGYAAEKEGRKTLAISFYQQAEELAEGKLLQKIQKRKDSLLKN